MVRNLTAVFVLTVAALGSLAAGGGKPWFDHDATMGRPWHPPEWCADTDDPRAVVGRLCESPEERADLTRQRLVMDGVDAPEAVTTCNPRQCSIGCADGTSCSVSAPAGKYAVCTCSSYSAFCHAATCGT